MNIYNFSKKIVLAVLLLTPGLVSAAGGAALLYEAPAVDLADKAAMQRGARTFVNYCLSCHSAAFMRYKRVADDLGISEETTKKNLMFATDKIHSGMSAAMKADDAKRWFGVTPPDLSVTARARGRDWLYNYFLTFYRDDTKASGVNNATFKDVAMPNVLWELQGWQEPVYETHTNDEGKEEKALVSMKLVESGKQSEEEFKQTVSDLVAFMVYMGEPAGLQRHNLGIWVLGFLFILLIVSYMLKREYWKDVH